MNESFAAIDPERKKRILDAAYKEFASHGYKRASTNRIVAEAGIGKGPLFHYFGSKAGLFEFLVEYAGKYINEFISKICGFALETDIIERYKLASKFKLEMRLKEPYLFDFLAWLYLNKGEIMEIDEINKYVKKYIESMELIRADFMSGFNTNPDMSKFRGDIPSEKLAKYIGWIMDGYIQALINRVKEYRVLSDLNLEPYWLEFDEFMEDLKMIFYKR